MPRLPPRLAHIAIDPLDRGLRRRRLQRRAAPPAHRGQAGAAGPDADRRHRQHLRRRGAVAGPAARRPAHRPLTRGPGGRPARRRPRRAGRGAGAGRHLLRLALRRRQRPERLLRALPRRLRAGRPALPALRDADPPGVVHEPLELQLPALPAAPARPARHRCSPRRRARWSPRSRARSRASATAGSSAHGRAPPGWPGRRRNLPDGRVEVVAEGRGRRPWPPSCAELDGSDAPRRGRGRRRSGTSRCRGATGFTTA